MSPEGQYNSFSHHWQGSIDFNTVNTTRPTGMYFLIHPYGWINDERMAVHCLKSGSIGLYIPSDLKISLGPRDVPRASPSGHLSGLGNFLLVVGDVQPNISLLSAVYVYNIHGPFTLAFELLNAQTHRCAAYCHHLHSHHHHNCQHYHPPPPQHVKENTCIKCWTDHRV